MFLHVGTQVDKYEIVALLGEGAMARVFKVRHTGLNAMYALKVLQVVRTSVRERLHQEGKIQASLRHRNIVGVTDTITIDGNPGLVMEFIDGPDLDTFIQQHAEGVPIALAQEVGEGIIRGVRAAHRKGLLHRDLKPANVMMAREDDLWVPKVADFGLAKALDDGPSSSSSTKTGQIMGSPSYMSPEQARDSKNVDARTDVFSLGCILYELVANERAFEGPDFVATLARIAAGAYVPVDQRRPDLPAHMVAAIHGALAVDRDDRIPDCDTLFRVWRGEEGFVVPPPRTQETLSAMLGTVPHGHSPSVTTLGDVRPLSVPPPPEKTGSPVWWGLGLAAVGIVVAVGGIAVGGGLVAGVTILGGATSSELTTEPRPASHPTRPNPLPEPSPPPPTEPEAQPSPVQVPTDRPVSTDRPAPKVPAPAPKAPAPKVSEPVERPMVEPVAPVPPPEPVAEPVEPEVAMGRVTVSGGGATQQLWLSKEGRRFEPGAVPEGAYRVFAQFAGQDEAQDQKVTVRVIAGRATVIHCDALSWRCVTR